MEPLNVEDAALSSDERCQVLGAIAKTYQVDGQEEELVSITNHLEGFMEEQSSTDSGLTVLAGTIRRTLLEITEIKERNLERRHRELMQFLKENFSARREGDTMFNVDVREFVATDLKLDVQLQEEDQHEIMANEKKVEEDKEMFIHASVPVDPHLEYQLMREKRLEEHRQKMEDRERKKRRKSP